MPSIKGMWCTVRRIKNSAGGQIGIRGKSGTSTTLDGLSAAVQIMVLMTTVCRLGSPISRIARRLSFAVRAPLTLRVRNGIHRKNESIKVAARPLALGTNAARSPRSAKRGTRQLASLEVCWALHQGISESSKAAVFDRARGEMGRMHSKGKGKSRSALPYKRTPPSWLQLTSQEVRVSLSVSVLC